MVFAFAFAATPRAADARAPAGWPGRVEAVQSGSRTHAVVQGAGGFLWLATDRGLLRYDGVSLAAIAEGTVLSVSVDARGGLWFTRGDGALATLATTGVVARPDDGSRAAGEARALGRDAAGALWVAAPGWVSRFDGQAWRRWPAPQRPRRFHRRADGGLLLESDEEWTRVTEAGLTSIGAHLGYSQLRQRYQLMRRELLDEAARGLADRAEAAQHVVDLRYVEALLVDDAQRVWIGTEDGLICLDGDRVVRLDASDGLPDEHVRDLVADAEGNVWVLTHGGGLARVSMHPFAVVTPRQGLRGNTPFSVAESDDGSVYVTTVSGLSRIADGRVTNLDMPDPKRSVRALSRSARGTLWITTLGPELLEHDPRRGTFVAHPLAPLERGEIVSALVDEGGDRGVRLATSLGRLLRLVGGRVVVERPRPAACGATKPFSHCADSVVAFVPRARGGFWLATVGAGLFADEGGALRPVARAHEGPDNVWSVLERGDDVWISSGGGLWRLDARAPLPAAAPALEKLGPERGVAYGPVFHTVADDLGALWVGRLDGVHQLSPAGGGRFSDVRHAMSDGLPSDLVMCLDEPSALRARDGRIWFVTLTGLAVFDPLRRRQPPAPAPRLERVELERRAFAHPFLPPAIEVPPGRGDLTFVYTAPLFAAPHRVRFAYRLDGWDDHWIEAGARRMAHYTNLRPGRYVFRVRARRDDADGFGEASIAATIAPRFTQTVAFRVLVAGALVAAVLSGFWLRMRHVRARFAAVEDERRRIARDLHDTLAQIFASLGLQVDSMLESRRPPDAEAPALRQLRRTVAHGRRAARAVVWNLRGGEQPLVLERALGELTGLYEGAQVSIAVEGAAYALPVTAGREVLYIAQQAVSNAIEHGRAAHIGIQIEYEPERFSLWVRDDGAGFSVDEPAASTHAGLIGMRERAARAGGRLHVESAPGVGTEVGVVIERDKKHRQEKA